MNYTTSLLVILFFPVLVLAGSIKSLMDVSVTIETPRGTGSGTVFTAKGKTYVLTCGHVVEGLKTVQTVEEEVDGELKKIKKVIWEDAKITQTLYTTKDGVLNEAGSLSLLAKVIAFSAAEEDNGLDLAVLEVVKSDYIKHGANFATSHSDVAVGRKIYHIGSLYGDITNAYVTGEVSRLDYRLPNKKWSSFNVAILNSKPGSSGGGIFLKKNSEYQYCGMLVRGDRAGVALFKPSWVIEKWLKKKELDFIIKKDSDGNRSK